MPAFLTHRAAGERVLRQLGNGAIANEGAFYLGCQGPDILFFRNYYPWKSAKDSLRLGIEMHHEKVRALFARGLEFVKSYQGRDADELISYFAGFITHYAIDKNAHPFVYGKAGKNNNIHHALEFMWDSYTAKEQWDIEPSGFDIKADVMYGAPGSGVCGWYKAIAKDVYDKNIRPKVVHQAQKHFARAKNALADIKWPGRMLMNLISYLTGLDVSTMLYPESRDHSLFTAEEYVHMRQMIDRGVSEAAKMIRFVLDEIESRSASALPEWFGDTDFSGNVVSE